MKYFHIYRNFAKMNQHVSFLTIIILLHWLYHFVCLLGGSYSCLSALTVVHLGSSSSPKSWLFFFVNLPHLFPSHFFQDETPRFSQFIYQLIHSYNSYRLILDLIDFYYHNKLSKNFQDLFACICPATAWRTIVKKDAVFRMYLDSYFSLVRSFHCIEI